MNDAPDAPGYWGPSDQQYLPPYPAAPTPAAGDQHRMGHSQQPPVYWGAPAEQTQIMRPVQDGSGQELPWEARPGRHGLPEASPGAADGTAQGAEQPRVPGRLNGPLFRDEQPPAAVPAMDETVVLPSLSGLQDAPPQRQGARPRRGPQHPAPQHPVGPPYPAPDSAVPAHLAPLHPERQFHPEQFHPEQSHPERLHPEQFHPVPSYPGQETPVAQPDPQPRKQRGGRNLQAAIGVGVGLGVVVIASLFFVKALFLFVVMAAVLVGVWELSSRLTERKEIRSPLVPVAAGSVAMLATGYWAGAQWAAASLALTGLAVMVWRMAAPPENYLRDVTAGVFTAFYVPFLATFVAMMLAADDGPQRIVLFLIVTVCSDTGAYAVGYRFGKTKLAPAISPGKTREGLAGGIALSMVAGALLMQLIIDDGSWWQGVILGGCAAVTATLGDLGESMIKRDLGIKDMGTLLPGHGGIMDRLDSLLPTAPVVWLLLAAFVGS